MKKLFLVVLLCLIFVSCASYTIEEARGIIEYPQYENLPDTRFASIEAKKAIKENEKKAQEEELLRKERENAVNEYPEDLASISLPFYYNPIKNGEAAVNQELKCTFIPLGETPLNGNQIQAIVKCIEDSGVSIIALSGSITNQTKVATSLKLDAISVEGGTIIFKDCVFLPEEGKTVNLRLNDDQDITIYVMDQKPLLPSEGDPEEVTNLVNTLSDRDIESLVEYISQEGSERKLFFLSSYSPSSSDWTDWTDYNYRSEKSFMISSMLEDLKWQDAYALTHFSVETDPGYTRKNGDIEERLDFIYSKGLIPISSYTLPMETTNIIGIVATFLIPC